MPFPLYGSTGFNDFMSEAILETSSLSTPLIFMTVCFSTRIFTSFGNLKLTSWLKPICKFNVSPFKFALLNEL